MFGAGLTYTLKSLQHRKLRTWLTLVGILIGIAAVVSLVSLSQGLQVAIQEQFEKLGSDKIIIRPKGSFVGLESDAAVLTESDRRAIDRTRGVSDTADLTYKPARISLDDERLPTTTASVPDDDSRILAIEAQTLEISQGRWFDDDESEKVVIGNDYSRIEVLERKVHIGDDILVNDRSFEVVGVLKRTGDPVADQSVYMSESVQEELIGYDPEEVGFIVAQVNVGEDPSVVARRIERELRQQRDLEEGKEDFEVQTPEELLETFGVILNVIQAVLIGIAAISLLVGGIGIMNTMYTAVLERTDEIGVMKAVGARNRDIMVLFIVEAGILGTIGGILGILLGIGISKSVEIIGAQALGSPLIRAFFPTYLIIGAILFAFVVGALSGILPAYQAAKLQPVEALQKR